MTPTVTEEPNTEPTAAVKPIRTKPGNSATELENEPPLAARDGRSNARVQKTSAAIGRRSHTFDLRRWASATRTTTPTKTAPIEWLATDTRRRRAARPGRRSYQRTL